jgi:hypothetical protein
MARKTPPKNSAPTPVTPTHVRQDSQALVPLRSSDDIVMIDDDMDIKMTLEETECGTNKMHLDPVAGSSQGSQHANGKWYSLGSLFSKTITN